MRLFALLSVLAFATPIGAQSASGPTDRGSKLIAGSANFSRASSEGQSVTSINLQPILLHFIANRVAIGGEVGLGYTDHANGETTSWRLGPTARFYFGGSSSKTLPYLGAALLFGSASSSSSAPISVDSDQSIWGFEGVAGLTFMVSRQVGILGELFANRSENTFETSSTAKVTTTATNYGLRFGVAAFLF